MQGSSHVGSNMITICNWNAMSSTNINIDLIYAFEWTRLEAQILFRVEHERFCSLISSRIYKQVDAKLLFAYERTIKENYYFI